MTWLKPAPGPISSPFGHRIAPEPGATTEHEGVDIACPDGSGCHASQAGTVTTAGLTGGWGGLVVISHPDGHTTYYAHLSRIDVTRRQHVTQGEQIGLTGGRPGQWGAGTSTGPHCHHEHRINGRPVDPVPFWTTTTAEAGEEIMALDAADHQFMIELGQSIIDQVRGAGPYDDQPLTLKAVRDDIGYRDTALAHLQASISAVKPGTTADVTPILTAIKALPAATVAAIKAAL